MRRLVWITGLAISLGGCAITTPVMDAGGGTYVISAQAAPIRGPAIGIAQEDANAFCASHGGGHAVVIVGDGSMVSVTQNVTLGDGPSRADLHFRCSN